jgi:hypothetical protein
LPTGLRYTPGAIDFSRRFVPETFTPLFFTPLYAVLTEQQRLRYNQLHGCYCNEQIMFFEKFVGENVLPALMRDEAAKPLLRQLHAFLEEERRHTQMFYDLNRLCLPRHYLREYFYFIKIPLGIELLLGRVTPQSWFIPLFVWLMLLQEERAVYIGREIVRRKNELEPHFVALQRAHLADEIRHVQWDQEILAVTWDKTSSLQRKFHAALLTRIIGEFLLTPKRASLAVIAELVREFPELAPRWPTMRRALLALATDRDWNHSLYSRTIAPKTFARFDQWSEFSALSNTLLGYEPRVKFDG